MNNTIKLTPDQINEANNLFNGTGQKQSTKLLQKITTKLTPDQINEANNLFNGTGQKPHISEPQVPDLVKNGGHRPLSNYEQDQLAHQAVNDLLPSIGKIGSAVHDSWTTASDAVTGGDRNTSKTQDATEAVFTNIGDKTTISPEQQASQANFMKSGSGLNPNQSKPSDFKPIEKRTLGQVFKQKVALLFSASDEDKLRILQESDSGLKSRVDKQGNTFITPSVGPNKGKELIINKPGFSFNDLAQVVATLPAFIAATAVLPETIAGSAAAFAVGDAANQGIALASGGRKDFSIDEVVVSGATGGIFKVLEKPAKAILSKAGDIVKKGITNNKVAQAVKKQIEESRAKLLQTAKDHNVQLKTSQVFPTKTSEVMGATATKISDISTILGGNLKKFDKKQIDNLTSKIKNNITLTPEENQALADFEQGLGDRTTQIDTKVENIKNSPRTAEVKANIAADAAGTRDTTAKDVIKQQQEIHDNLSNEVQLDKIKEIAVEIKILNTTDKNITSNITNSIIKKLNNIPKNITIKETNVKIKKIISETNDKLGTILSNNNILKNSPEIISSNVRKVINEGEDALNEIPKVLERLKSSIADPVHNPLSEDTTRGFVTETSTLNTLKNNILSDLNNINKSNDIPSVIKDKLKRIINNINQDIAGILTAPVAKIRDVAHLFKYKIPNTIKDLIKLRDEAKTKPEFDHLDRLIKIFNNEIITKLTPEKAGERLAHPIKFLIINTVKQTVKDITSMNISISGDVLANFIDGSKPGELSKAMKRLNIDKLDVNNPNTKKIVRDALKQSLEKTPNLTPEFEKLLLDNFDRNFDILVRDRPILSSKEKVQVLTSLSDIKDNLLEIANKPPVKKETRSLFTQNQSQQMEMLRKTKKNINVLFDALFKDDSSKQKTASERIGDVVFGEKTPKEDKIISGALRDEFKKAPKTTQSAIIKTILDQGISKALKSGNIKDIIEGITKIRHSSAKVLFTGIHGGKLKGLENILNVLNKSGIIKDSKLLNAVEKLTGSTFGQAATGFATVKAIFSGGAIHVLPLIGMIIRIPRMYESKAVTNILLAISKTKNSNTINLLTKRLALVTTDLFINGVDKVPNKLSIIGASTAQIIKNKNDSLLNLKTKLSLAKNNITSKFKDSFGFPIDTNRPKLINKDGSFSTEFTITVSGSEVGMKGKNSKLGINIPTIFNGERHTSQEAIRAFKNGINPSVGIFNTVDLADKAAVVRSKDIGKIRDNK